MTTAGPPEGFLGFAYLNVEDPVVAWGVYRGVLVSAAIKHENSAGPASMMFAGIVHGQNNAQLQNELVIDFVRSRSHPHQVSRLSGMYFFTDRDDARAAEQWGGHFRQENLAELWVVPAAPPTRVDANWITYAPLDAKDRLDASDLSWIDRYWTGEPYPNQARPVWETIVFGRAVVHGTELRKRAYDVIRTRFPHSVDTLELARLGAAVGADLGRVVAWIRRVDHERLRMDYYIDMEQAHDPDILARLKAFDGPVNLADLQPWKETMGLPDFRPYSCEFTVSMPLGLDLTTVQSLPSIHRVDTKR